MKINTIRNYKTAFCDMRYDRDLAALLKTPAYKLHLLAIKPNYNCFGIPKKDGSKR